MSVRITIYDGATPMLDQIALISRMAGLAALDKAGKELLKSTREAFKASTSHYWHLTIVNGKRRYWYGQPRAEFGKRQSPTGKAGPDNMVQHITSYLMDKSLTLVVGGKHKAFRAKYYGSAWDAGVRDPAQVKEAGNRTGHTDKGTWEILNKLAKGGRLSQQSDAYKNTRLKYPHVGPSDPFFRPRNWHDRGRSAAMPAVQNMMGDMLAQMIGRQVNRTTAKVKMVNVV